MSKKTLMTTLAAIACTAAVAAGQAPPTPQVPGPPSQVPAPAQPPTERKSSAISSVTLTGCLERKAEGSSTTPGAVGTAGAVGGADAAFVLTKVMKPTGTAGSASATAAPLAASYRLDADNSKLAPNVGKKVEIMGTIADQSGRDASEAPRLKVDSVKMIAASCTD
jgi:hypothetical protein